MNKEYFEKELLKGKVPLFLKSEDIKFLISEWRKIPENISDESKDAWARIAFHASSALHKNDIKNDAGFPKEAEKYILK